MIGASSPKVNASLAARRSRWPGAARERPNLATENRTLAKPHRYNSRVEPRHVSTRHVAIRQLAALPYSGKAIIRNHGHDADLDDFGQGGPRRQHSGKTRVALGGFFRPDGEFHGERLTSGLASTLFVRICVNVVRLRKDRARTRVTLLQCRQMRELFAGLVRLTCRASERGHPPAGPSGRRWFFVLLSPVGRFFCESGVLFITETQRTTEGHREFETSSLWFSVSGW